MFLQNSWYVFGWANEILPAGKPVGRVIIEQPVVVWRDQQGIVHAAEDRCPHRHAPLSLGRVNGDTIQCMYHGMTFGSDGRCVHMPMMDQAPSASIRIYPAVEKDSWIWIWTGAPELADQGLIPSAFGIDDPDRPMRSNSIEYDAHYQLVHDNLCDLSHVDFVHEATLRQASGAPWAQTAPRITSQDRAVRVERWFEAADYPGHPGEKVDTWITYDFAVPGIFILQGARYPLGTAKKCAGREPHEEIVPLVRNVEQQAVTPISATRTAYHYATGLIGNTPEMTRTLATRMDVIMAAFQEDREMIEAQQKVWDLTDPATPKLFLPQDKGPFLMRRMMERLIRLEQEGAKSPAADRSLAG